MPLVGLEVDQRSGPGLDRLATRLDQDSSVHDQHPGVLLDLMVAELLPLLERDQHRAGLRLGMEDDGRAAAARRLDRLQIPALHKGDRTPPR